ncbi:site-specific integrase [Deinococcus oregonensis]|uniref:Site-specific integrase n=1 Tax=Deinococcus oregonensis TaxID=1805970 RepID=A0ABV6B6R6_9DEIO
MHTLRAYTTDLRHLKTWLESEHSSLSGTTLRHYFATHPDWAAATVSRKHSTLQRFSRWALRKELLLKDPTLDLEHVQLPSIPQGAAPGADRADLRADGHVFAGRPPVPAGV